VNFTVDATRLITTIVLGTAVDPLVTTLMVRPQHTWARPLCHSNWVLRRVKSQPVLYLMNSAMLGLSNRVLVATGRPESGGLRAAWSGSEPKAASCDRVVYFRRETLLFRVTPPDWVPRLYFYSPDRDSRSRSKGNLSSGHALSPEYHFFFLIEPSTWFEPTRKITSSWCRRLHFLPLVLKSSLRS